MRGSSPRIIKTKKKFK